MNKWKMLFIVLLLINISVVGLLITLIMLPADENEPIALLKDNRSDGVEFYIKSNKSDLNTIIDQYVETEIPKNGIAYKVILHDEVELYGTIKVFSQDVQMRLTFEPEALQNGDLILNQKSISIGQLNLPVPYVLRFVADRYTLPSWVTIQPNDELVYVSLQKMNLKSGLKVKVNKFDLKNDDILFTLIFPIEK